jgi:hypothetical protein
MKTLKTFVSEAYHEDHKYRAAEFAQQADVHKAQAENHRTQCKMCGPNSHDAGHHEDIASLHDQLSNKYAALSGIHHGKWRTTRKR